MNSEQLILYGELRGFLAAFAEVNMTFETDFTFSLDHGKLSSTLEDSLFPLIKQVDTMFDVSEIRLFKIQDPWRKEVAQALHKWLFAYCQQLEPKRIRFTLATSENREELIQKLLDKLEQITAPDSVARVTIQARSYCGDEIAGFRDSFAFQSGADVFLLHLGSY